MQKERSETAGKKIKGKIAKYDSSSSQEKFNRGNLWESVREPFKPPKAGQALPVTCLVFVEALGFNHIAFIPVGAVGNEEVDPYGAGEAHQGRLEQDEEHGLHAVRP